MLANISEKIKNMSTAVTGIFGTIAAIGGAVIYVENNYANAQDVKTVVRSQSLQIKQSLMFQLDYYDDRIKKLETERNKSEEILSDRNIPRSLRAYTRKPEDIQEEIKELKARREMIKNELIQSETVKP